MQLRTRYNAENLRMALIYTVVVILPLLLFSLTYLQYKFRIVESLAEEEAQRISGIQSMYIESFIGETKGRLESLSLVLGAQEENPGLIERILLETHSKDPRFSGFYWANAVGEIVISTNAMEKKVNLSDRDYFRRAIHSHNSEISNVHLGRVTGRYIISIATPIVRQDGLVRSMLIGSIQLDRMEQMIGRLSNNRDVLLLDTEGNTVLQTLGPQSKGRRVSSKVELKAVPWKVTTIITLNTYNMVVRPYLNGLFIAFFLLNILFLLLRQILDKRRMARELSENEAHKLQLIGSIAASTAHEIRNPLTGIKGFITLLGEKYRDEKDQYYFSLIQHEVDRINAIVNELLIMGKPAAVPAVQQVSHVNDILAEVIPFIESEAQLHQVQFIVKMTPQPAHIEVSKDHLKQIVLNLTKNAIEAMEEGGKLTIETDVTETSQVLLKVRDTGRGMPPEVVKKLFVPFFTLKRNGTGLGLVLCKQIAESFGGVLTIDSAVGKGTLVTVQIPMASDRRGVVPGMR